MKKLGLLFSILFAITFVSAQNQLIDLQGVFQGKYRYDRIKSLTWRPNTTQYAYYDDTKDVIVGVDLQKGQETVLFDYQQFYDFVAPDKNARYDQDAFHADGGRISKSYQWDDANTLRIYCRLPDKTSSHYAIYDLKKKQLTLEEYETGAFGLAAEDEHHGLYIYTLDEQGGYYVNDFRNPIQERVILCPDTAQDVVFGEPVHRSEWGIDEGWYFSPNSNYIAFYRMDQSMVEDYPLLQTSDGPRSASIAYIKNIKYPMAGRSSHQVKVGIFDARKSLESKKCVYHYIQTDLSDGEFLTNVTFSPDEKYLYITHLNREQNHSKLIRYDVATGKKLAVLIEEQDSRYVEPQHRMIFVGADKFLWHSDRDGWNHLYLYTFDGQLVKQLTKGNWPVLEDMGLSADGKYVYIMTNKDNPVDRYLYRVSMADGSMTKITPESGTHTILLSPDKKYYFDYFSSLHTPYQIWAGSTDGKTRKMLKNCESPYASCGLGRDTIFSLKNANGDDLYCEMILPPNFDQTKRYPCLVYVYGGPHSQLVTNTYMTGGVFLNYMAQKGYVVFVMDNRGTNNRGAEFEKCIHRRLGVCESEDQMVGIDYLRSLPYIDASRMGIDGWSFGGFMTLTMVTEHPDVFRSASCGGPVVNWEWYEIMYGERYMDTPQENPEGYAHANIIPKIKNLSCPLLVMHGQQDNTVVQQHSLELLHQSVLEDVQINYFPYTTHEHNVMGIDRVQMWHKIEQFHDQYLMR